MLDAAKRRHLSEGAIVRRTLAQTQSFVIFPIQRNGHVLNGSNRIRGTVGGLNVTAPEHSLDTFRVLQ